MDDNNKFLYLRAGASITCCTWLHVLLHVPVIADHCGHKTEKERYAYTPFLARINTIEGKVWPSHVHALVARFEDHATVHSINNRATSSQPNSVHRFIARLWQNLFVLLMPFPTLQKLLRDNLNLCRKNEVCNGVV